MNTNAQPDLEGDGATGATCDATDSWASCARNSIAQIEGFVQRDPKTAMLISLGAGLGLGVFVGIALAGSPRRRPSDWFDRQSAEQLGHRFMDAISKVVPAAVSDYFGER